MKFLALLLLCTTAHAAIYLQIPVVITPPAASFVLQDGTTSGTPIRMTGPQMLRFNLGPFATWNACHAYQSYLEAQVAAGTLNLSDTFNGFPVPLSIGPTNEWGCLAD